MKHAPHHLAALLLAAAVLVAGCGKAGDPVAPATTPGGTTAADQREIETVLATVPELAEDGLYMGEEETDLSLAGSGSATFDRTAELYAPIRPLRYWRRITNVQRRVEFEFTRPDSNGDPQAAIVTIHKRLTGTFNILTGDRDSSSTGDGAALAAFDHTPGDPPDLDIVRKALADHWTRRVLLLRVRSHETDRVLWRVAATSGVKVTSVKREDQKAPVAPTRIRSLRVRTAHMDTTITNPLAFIFLRNILKMVPEQRVQLTVETDAPDDVVVLLHRGMRFRFHPNGDNTYTGLWRVPSVSGIHHVGVNALSRGTLFDDHDPYCSDAWILPYVTVNLERDYMP